jgi:glycine hydroxymethyltransferase
MGDSDWQSTLELLTNATRESEKQMHRSISLVASSMYSPKAIRNFGQTVLGNVTAEGYPNRRYHPGAEHCDLVESIAIDETKRCFGASYANVQSHSASSANMSAMLSFLQPGDTILGMSLKAGGHLTHGSSASFSGKIFNAHSYGLTRGRIDLNQVREMAKKVQPKMIICGGSAYPRSIDFEGFKNVADEVGAYLLADISHISGLVATGLHSSPVSHADFVTTSTYKQLLGPHGGLIFSNNRGGEFARKTDSGVFPLTQGTPDFARIAGKAAALALTQTSYYHDLMHRIKYSAARLAKNLKHNGITLLTGGTDTHLLLIDLRPHEASGRAIEEKLVEIGIFTNRNLIDGDNRTPREASGLRIGTNMIGYRNFNDEAIDSISLALSEVINAKGKLTEKRFKTLKQTTSSIACTFPVKEPDW